LEVIDESFVFQGGLYSSDTHQVEKTIECNPGTISSESVDQLIQTGFNRFSLGAQSFSDFSLRLLGRIHDVESILESFYLLRKKGVGNINLDLIFGLPGQTLNQWRIDLEKVIELRPEHLSIYGLTIEPGTEYGRLYQIGQIVLPEEDIEARMYELSLDLLTRAGYEQYEISNFSLPGYQCRHNLVYWENGSYLGFGPSAASYMNGSRWTNTSDWNRYLSSAEFGRVFRENEERLSGKEAFVEELIISLRLTSGIRLEALGKKHDVKDLTSIKKGFSELIELSLIREDSTGSFQLTTRGKLLASEVSVRLMGCMV
jgi:oxygen-independent coproporphyrinogen-3 oxidase